jgi:hypothetical protein
MHQALNNFSVGVTMSKWLFVRKVLWHRNLFNASS